MQMSSLLVAAALVAFALVPARGAGMARVQIDVAGSAKQAVHSANHPSAGWVLIHHGSCATVSSQEYVPYAHTLIDCEAACEEHGNCDAISYGSGEHKCLLHHGAVDPPTMSHDPYLCYTRTATTETTTTTCVADCGFVNDKPNKNGQTMTTRLVAAGLTQFQIEHLCMHDGVWYYMGESTAVGGHLPAGADCPGREDTPVFCAGDDSQKSSGYNTFGNRKQQAEAVALALNGESEGTHPLAPENAHTGSITQCTLVTTTTTTTTTADLGCTDHGGVASDAMVMDFAKATITTNNLGGMGPNYQDPEELRYQAIMTLPDGRDVDLVVTAESPYERTGAATNSKTDEFGKINVKVGHGVELKFGFESTSTGHPVKMPAFLFSLGDFDESADRTAQEKVMIKDFEQYYLTADTEVEVGRMGDGRTTFSSSTQGTGPDNPSEFSKLTLQQANRMVTFLFPEGLEAFHATFQVGTATGNYGRNFVFSGRSAVLECGRPLTTTTTTTTVPPPPTCITHDVSMNLNFFGSAVPISHLSFERGQEMVFENVGRTADGNHVNMVVKALSPYKPHNRDLNHVWWKGAFGLINLQAQEDENHVDLSFTFRNPATDEQVTLEHLDLSFLDLDGGRTSARETVTISGFQSYYLSADSDVTAEPLTDGRWRFGSSVFGERADNPDDPHQLTTAQAKKAVNLVFADVSEILLTLTVDPSIWVYGRDFMMAGTSAVKDPNCGVKHQV